MHVIRHTIQKSKYAYHKRRKIDNSNQNLGVFHVHAARAHFAGTVANDGLRVGITNAWSPAHRIERIVFLRNAYPNIGQNISAANTAFDDRVVNTEGLVGIFIVDFTDISHVIWALAPINPEVSYFRCVENSIFIFGYATLKLKRFKPSVSGVSGKTKSFHKEKNYKSFVFT